MKKKVCIIVGNGSAGKRHALYAKRHGLEVVTADPLAQADFESLSEALDSVRKKYTPDEIVGVVATPPGVHAANLFTFLSWGVVRVMCEKPLYGLNEQNSFGEMEREILVSYNWMWHTEVKRAYEDVRNIGRQVHLDMHTKQARDLPYWGLLLDHVSHCLSITSTIMGPITLIKSAKHTFETNYWGDPQETWNVRGRALWGTFEIAESVVPSTAKMQNRTGALTLTATDGTFRTTGYSLGPQASMYDDMWQDFVLGYIPSFDRSWKMARSVQYYLDVIDCIAEEERI